MKNGVDDVNGGVYTCLDRDGTLMDTTKSVWFQGRFAFTCAYAYNNIEKNPQWLSAAKQTLDFIEKYCFDTDGKMLFAVSATGEPIRRRRYVFSECFATIAYAEYAKATGIKEYADKALELFLRMQQMLNTPGFLEPKSYIAARGHSITMMMLNVGNCVRQVCNDPLIDKQIETSINDLRDYFIHPEYEALMEMVTPEGDIIDTCEGRTINPGHCIETAWFLLEEASTRGGDSNITQMATTILDWSWKWGWDEEFGGIINFRDCKNFPPQDYSQDMKFWWPQCETIIATLYAYKATGDEKYMEMHRRIHEYTYGCFPDSEFGEWYGYLHRDGTVAQPAKGNLFKGPFHIPRMMIKSHLLCEEILKSVRFC